MFLDKDSIKVNGISFGQYLVSVQYNYPKLFASDSGRNLAGRMISTLIGIYPKLVMQFRILSKEELNIIAPILDSATQQVTYYDPTKNSNITIETYTSDWSIENRGKYQNRTFSCSFISVDKRG